MYHPNQALVKIPGKEDNPDNANFMEEDQSGDKDRHHTTGPRAPVQGETEEFARHALKIWLLLQR